MHRADDASLRHRKAPIAHERAGVDLAAAEIAERNIRRYGIANGKDRVAETIARCAIIEAAGLDKGFGSIRRFNETFLTLFGRAPCTLRRGGGPEISATPGGHISLRLRYQPPYDWPGVLAFLRLRAIPGIERVGENSYSRTIALHGRQGIVSIRPAEDNALLARIRFPKLSALDRKSTRLNSSH